MFFNHAGAGFGGFEVSGWEKAGRAKFWNRGRRKVVGNAGDGPGYWKRGSTKLLSVRNGQAYVLGVREARCK